MTVSQQLIRGFHAIWIVGLDNPTYYIDRSKTPGLRTGAYCTQ